MFNYIPSVSGTASTSKSPVNNGVDVLISIQLLLVQDYDVQLRGMADQIKQTTEIKKLYRADVVGMQNYLTLPNVDGTKGDDARVRLTYDQYIALNRNNMYLFDGNNNKIVTRVDPELGSIPGNRAIGAVTREGDAAPVFYDVKKKDIEVRVEQVSKKLEAFNEQTELTSLGLQSLTNQRKIALETVSNIVSKYHDAIATITRNVKG